MTSALPGHQQSSHEHLNITSWVSCGNRTNRALPLYARGPLLVILWRGAQTRGWPPPAVERSLWRRPLTGRDAEFNWQNVQLDSSWHYAKDATDVDVSAMCVGLCCWFIGGHLVCDWRPCSKQTTTQTYTWQGRGASPIDRSTWAPAPCVSLIIAVAVNIDPFTSRSVDTAARAFVFFLKKRKSYQRTY